MDEQTFADITLDINENWTHDLGRGTKNKLMPTVSGVDYAVLSTQFPDEERSDTSYYAYLYMGNWLRPDMKKRVLFNFKYNKHYGSLDKKLTGKPAIENLVVYIDSHHYKNLMKVIESIDWTKFDALVKR